MSKPNSQLTTKSPPITDEERRRRSKLICRNMTNFGKCSFGDHCHYSHVMTRPVYDPQTHRRAPSPPKQAHQTEKEIVEKLIEENPDRFGKSSTKYLKTDPTLKFLHALAVFSKSLASLAPTDENPAIDKKSLLDSMTAFRSCSGNEAFNAFIGKNIEILGKPNSNVTSIFTGIRTAFEVPDEAMRLFCVPETEQGSYADAFAVPETEQGSYAGALKVDQLELAKRTQEGVPSKEFLDHLSSACGLFDNEGFIEMRRNHERLGTFSAYKVKDFLAILTLFEASKEVKRRLDELERQELAIKQDADVKVALMRECITHGNPHLKTAFGLLTSLPELTAFAKNLSEEDQNVLILVFGSFVAYLSHQVQMSTSFKITCDSLTSSFASFTKSRRLDHESLQLKTVFFEFVKKPCFAYLKTMLAMTTSSIHKKSGLSLDVGEVFKRMLKELLPIYLDKLPSDMRDCFCVGLAKKLLPFAYLLFIAPTHSYMLSGQWKTGFQHNGKLIEVYDYAEMQDGKEKSILYWLLQNLRKTEKLSTRKKSSGIDSFAKLSSMFTSQKTGADGEIKQEFEPELLFNALDEVLESNFLNASSFPINMKMIEEKVAAEAKAAAEATAAASNNFTLLFNVSDGRLVVNPDFPDEIGMVLYYVYGATEDDIKTRQLSEFRAALKCDLPFILEVINSIMHPTHDLNIKSIAILKTMRVDNPNKRTGKAMANFLTLLEESKSEGLLRDAYDIMSLANMLVKIQGRMFFMSLVDALLVVLLQEKFKQVKLFDIMRIVYGGKMETRLSFQVVERCVVSMDNRDIMKGRLNFLLGKDESRSNEEELSAVKLIVGDISELLCKANLPDNSPHDIMTRVMPFILNPVSMTLLLGTVPGFECERADDKSPNIEDWLAIHTSDFFESESKRFLSGQANQISYDLSKRMKKVELPADRLKAIGFAKFQSSIVNVTNKFFSSIELPYNINHEHFCSDFPKTARRQEPEKHIAIHAMKVLSRSDNSVEFPMTEDMNKYVLEFVLKAVCAVCRTVIPVPKKELIVKVDTVPLSDVKTELRKLETICEFFKQCLKYWKSDFAREFILGILQHMLDTANVSFIREYYSIVQDYDVQFSAVDMKNYSKLFSFLTSEDDSISAKENYDTSDEDFFEIIKDSTGPDHWNDPKPVEVSKPVVRKALGGIQIRKVKQPIESVMAIGGGPAPEPVLEEESDPESDEQSKGQCDIETIRRILTSDNMMEAIKYLNSVNLDDDKALIEILEYLQSDDSKCADALEAINQSYESDD